MRSMSRLLRIESSNVGGKAAFCGGVAIIAAKSARTMMLQEDPGIISSELRATQVLHMHGGIRGGGVSYVLHDFGARRGDGVWIALRKSGVFKLRRLRPIRGSASRAWRG
jgi:hypothetical protein